MPGIRRVQIDALDEPGVDHRRADADVEEKGDAHAVEVVADVAGRGAADEEERQPGHDRRDAGHHFDRSKRVAEGSGNLPHLGSPQRRRRRRRYRTLAVDDDLVLGWCLGLFPGRRWRLGGAGELPASQRLRACLPRERKIARRLPRLGSETDPMDSREETSRLSEIWISKWLTFRRPAALESRTKSVMQRRRYLNESLTVGSSRDRNGAQSLTGPRGGL